MKKNSVFIKSYYGFGDNIWIYPFIKEACIQHKEVYLETFFPFIFHALPNIKFVKPIGGRTLRTCNEIARSYPESFWTSKPIDIETLRFPYYLSEFRKNKNLVQCFNEGINISTKKIDYTLPLKNEWIENAKQILNNINTNKKICLIKLPSDRRDWKNSARIPKPEYFQYLINKYKDEYYFISIGNRKTEIYIKDLDNIDLRFENEELSLTTIMGLTSLTDMIITYNCFFYPLGLSLKTKTFVISGGYTDPKMYTDFDRVDTKYLKVINPNNQCMCINRVHYCPKDIDLNYLDEKFQELSRLYHPRPKYQKIYNILICRMRAERAYKMATNPYLKNKFKFFTVDHSSVAQYKQYNLFEECYKFPKINDILRPNIDDEKRQEIYNFCKKMLTKHNINIVLNAQPLHPYNGIMRQVCKELKIEHFNTETFCDDKWVFDKIGCQYTFPNEIYKYVNKLPLLKNIPLDLPKNTRQPQPSTITKEVFFKKYGLNKEDKYIVFLGQLLWDMSIKVSANIFTKTYEKFVDLVLKSNPNIKFIVKHHPLYIRTGRYKEVSFFKNYPNVIIVNESIDTLFNIFNNFVSFSSTTILEGIIRNKKFATMGFHFCNNDDLVIQLKNNSRAEYLYKQLENFNINFITREHYLRFICNYYTIDLSSQKLYDRLTMSSDKYFSQES